MPPLPPLTLEINRGSSTIRVHGKRSRRGWTITAAAGATTVFSATRPLKADAIRLALDACDPDTPIHCTISPT